jgi:hypothetical protein
LCYTPPPGYSIVVVDEVTFARFTDAMRQSLHDGTPLLDVLDQWGLLHNRQREREVGIAVINNLIVQLEEIPATALANIGDGQTVAGAVAGCIKFTKLYLKMLERSP